MKFIDFALLFLLLFVVWEILDPGEATGIFFELIRHFQRSFS